MFCAVVLLAFPLSIGGKYCLGPGKGGTLILGSGGMGGKTPLPPPPPPKGGSLKQLFPFVSLKLKSFLCSGKDLNLRDSYLRSATTSSASLDGVDRTVPGVDREAEPLLPVVDTKPASSGDEEPGIDIKILYFKKHYPISWDISDISSLVC